MEKINKDKRILELEELIRTWDRLASNNPNNIHGLQTSKRQDWVDELMDLKNKEDN